MAVGEDLDKGNHVQIFANGPGCGPAMSTTWVSYFVGPLQHILVLGVAQACTAGKMHVDRKDPGLHRCTPQNTRLSSYDAGAAFRGHRRSWWVRGNRRSKVLAASSL